MGPLKLATYKRIEKFTLWACSWGALAAIYGSLYLARSFWITVFVAFISLLPYLIGYNIMVRGWLRRKVVE
jgi:hypothetical protein